jgi:hypothetical protein
VPHFIRKWVSKSSNFSPAWHLGFSPRRSTLAANAAPANQFWTGFGPDFRSNLNNFLNPVYYGRFLSELVVLWSYNACRKCQYIYFLTFKRGQKKFRGQFLRPKPSKLLRLLDFSLKYCNNFFLITTIPINNIPTRHLKCCWSDLMCKSDQKIWYEFDSKKSTFSDDIPTGNLLTMRYLVL